ncbi:MAG: hypothetical protein JSV99_08050 [Planctomycetota bacterium]|nr:MAG: hypothetical protein JSV99_08050 [Planctomycetota bacterium]
MDTQIGLKTAMVVVVLVCVFCSGAFGQPWDGNGAEGDPYQIWTAADMQAIGADANYWDAHFELMADIDLSAYTGTSFNIIGSNPYWPTEGTAFTGVFDGNGHTISNFTYTSTGKDYVGVFGYVGGGGEIRSLGLISSDVSGRNQTGALVGTGGTITDCHVEGGLIVGGDEVGGLVGSYGTITDCYTEAVSVSGNSKVGGLVGHNGDAKITNCYSAGSVTGVERVGGLVGLGGRIYNCYASGSVSGVNWVGGLVGVGSAVMNCYSTGIVIGDSNVGGLVGYTSSIAVGSFWDIQTSGQTTSASGTGLTTAEMKDANTYRYWGCEPGWTHNAGVDYPRLWWENLPGEVLDAELSDFVGGGGTESDPYLIYTGEELNAIGLFWCEWHKDFRLMADIDLSAYTGTSFNIIGADWEHPFTGVFDGSGHTISNFSYTATGQNNIGLFGYVREKDALIKDLGLVNPNVSVVPSDKWTASNIGSLAGTVTGGAAGSTITEGGRISGCYVEGGSVSGRSVVGGLVGEASRGTVANCYSTATVSATGYTAGGLVGGSEAKISNCYSSSNVSGTSYIGGLVGNNYSGHSTASHKGGTIMSCYARGSVSGTTAVGGLVGRNRAAEVSNSYSTGGVSGTTEVGGLVGSIEESTVTDSFWDKQSSGQSTSSGGTGLTTAEMQDINTFLAAGWDFVGEYGNGPSDEWAEPEAPGYMILWWQLDPLPPLPTFSGGTGTESEPYLISNGIDLNRIGHNPRLMERHFRLINDINVSGLNIWSIGSSKAFPFAGVFEGNGHEISNFSWDSNGIDYIGLFSYVNGQDAEIKDLGLIEPNIAAGTGTLVGSLVGQIDRGTITNCYAEGGSVSGHAYVGGLVGLISGGSVSNCHAGGCNVSGSTNVGGLVGKNSGTIANCDAVGSVTGTGSNIGGLVGANGGTVTDCYSEGSVSGGDRVGGLVGGGGAIINCHSTAVVGGNNWVGGLAGNASLTSNCWASGEVTAENHVGGLLGGKGNGTVTNCYSKGDVTGGEDVGGLVGYNYDREAFISNCYSTGSASGATDVGGLVGENHKGAIIDNCYAHGDAAGVLSVGGLVGKNSTYIDTLTGERYYGTITHCYSVGAVTAFVGDTDIGGLVGLNDGQATGSLWDAETSGRSNMCGSQGAEGSGCDDGNGKTTAEMQTGSTFIDAGWDFVTPVWTIDEGLDYPRFAWEPAALSADIDMDEFWTYQSIAGQGNSELTASVSITDDPMGNSSYSYAWEIVLPGDVTLAPVTVDGGGASDAYWTFAARGCDEPGGLSDSGQTFTVRVTVTGDDYGNTGQAEAEFGIALLGDTNNDGVVNVADRSITNAFWRTGSAGPYTLRDCDVNCDGVVNVADRSIANAIWRGILGQNSVSSPCPLR